jgi:hypothetical protein
MRTQKHVCHETLRIGAEVGFEASARNVSSERRRFERVFYPFAMECVRGGDMERGRVTLRSNSAEKKKYCGFGEWQNSASTTTIAGLPRA